MSAQFTPGPWEVEQDTTLVWARDGGSVNGTPIARCETQYRHWGRSVSMEEHDANARLIAAAPGLYALAEQFERVAEYQLRKKQRENPGDDEGIRLQQLNLSLIRAEIAKVRGEQVPE